MIKRRFYRLEHGERDSGSDSSSFSSESELETEESAESEDDVAAEVSEDDSLSEPKEEDEPTSVSSGLLNADSQSDEDNTNVGIEDDADSDEQRERLPKMKLSAGLGLEASNTKSDTMEEKELGEDIPDCMIRCKSVFKCRYCPNIVCLNEATMRAHVASKKHARSERLLRQGKLKAIDSDGEVDNQEIAEGTHTLDMTSEKRRKGRKMQRERKTSQRKEKVKNGGNGAAVEQPMKKRHQTKD